MPIIESAKRAPEMIGTGDTANRLGATHQFHKLGHQ